MRSFRAGVHVHAERNGAQQKRRGRGSRMDASVGCFEGGVGDHLRSAALAARLDQAMRARLLRYVELAVCTQGLRYRMRRFLRIFCTYLFISVVLSMFFILPSHMTPLHNRILNIRLFMHTPNTPTGGSGGFRARTGDFPKLPRVLRSRVSDLHTA